MNLREDEGLLMGTVDFGGVQRDVCMAYVAGEAQVGAYVIVHVGFAISLVAEEEARRTFQLLQELEDTGALGSKDPSADASPPSTGSSAPDSGRPPP